MKTNFYTKQIATLLLLLVLISGNLFSQNIIYVYTPATLDPETSENPDMVTVAILEEAGYDITLFEIFDITTASDDQLAQLNEADLIFIGRAVGSTNFQDPAKQIWNSIEAPIMTCNMWALRSNRMNWFNTEACVGGGTFGSEDVVEVDVYEIDDPVFADIDVSAGWWIGSWNTIEADDAGYGTVMAVELASGNFRPVFVRFEAGEEFYDGAGDEPVGPRTFMGMDADNSGASEFNYSAYTEEALQVFLNEIAYLTGTLEEDNTGIFDYENQLKATVYPTIVKDVVQVEMNNLSKVEIINLDGKVINTTTANEKKLSVNLSDIKSGVYFIKLTNKSNKSVSEKIIKQ